MVNGEEFSLTLVAAGGIRKSTNHSEPRSIFPNSNWQSETWPTERLLL